MLKIGEMVKMLKFAGPLSCTPPPLQNFPLQLQHLQHFAGNVEDCPLTTSTSSTFPLFRALVLKNTKKGSSEPVLKMASDCSQERFFRSWDDLLLKKRVSTSKMFDVDKSPFLPQTQGVEGFSWVIGAQMVRRQPYKYMGLQGAFIKISDFIRFIKVF